MCMPDNLRLDMAIKYSSETYIDTLEEVRIIFYFTNFILKGVTLYRN